MAYLQFITEYYIITVEYEEEEDIRELCKFESERITSLLDRKIELPRADYRVWDSVREITVKQDYS